ncbi:MAG: hypothetical protein P0Y53_22320 [Candidatus Pseudobacter hemicellulosilyticus]|uniref:Uncharacterized protein n=1 Tax=Candidatus Pseudobacter hemicellulosilyticus TaxID=3121375 RepID=A0AAJ5WVQ2_9BACT|nr:MAG: hypothetical protein P0Y53_22320 [Pseudobacter sp.]
MIKLSTLQPGDIVMAEYEGQQTEGVVKELNREDHEVCVETPVQEFWFKPEDLYPIPLSEAQLIKLGFSKQVNEDSTIKYMKGPFRVMIAGEGDFHKLEIWYREDRRHLHEAIYVHELQNHYYQMTKVELNPA